MVRRELLGRRSAKHLVLISGGENFDEGQGRMLRSWRDIFLKINRKPSLNSEAFLGGSIVSAKLGEHLHICRPEESNSQGFPIITAESLEHKDLDERQKFHKSKYTCSISLQTRTLREEY